MVGSGPFRFLKDEFNSDEARLRSCMTLFAAAERGESSVFRQVLDRYFAGETDAATMALL